MSPDFTKIELGEPQSPERSGKAWASPEGIDIKAAYDASDMDAVSYTHLTLPTTPYV